MINDTNVTTIERYQTMDTQDKQTDSFETKVNTLVSTVERDENGKLSFPEGTDESLVFAARTEIRRRDTQSALSAEKSNNQRLTAENEQLAASWEADAVEMMTAAEQASLEELKHQDPDAWHAKLVELKGEKKTKFSERRQAITTKATEVSQNATREEVLAAFNEKHPGVLTDDKLQNDIPPRIVRELEDGKVSYEQFLQNCVDYLDRGRVMDKGTKASDTTDLSTTQGGGTPSEAAAGGQDSADYADTDW